LGGFHLRFPQYNSISLRDALASFHTEALVVTVIEAAEFKTSNWQHTEEIALAMSIIPWARLKKIPYYGLLEKSPDPKAFDDFYRYLKEYNYDAEKLTKLARHYKDIEELIAQSLDWQQVHQELLPKMRFYLEMRENYFEDGPATDWLRARAHTLTQSILNLPHQHLAILASLEQAPFLEDALRVAGLNPHYLPPPAISEEAKERAILDFAFNVDHPNPANVLASLKTINKAEARYHEANILLRHNHIREAWEILEEASHHDFSEPYFLPSYLLTRLGQLRDLTGRRSLALKAYQAVKALDWAAQEALEVAEQGLKEAFRLEPDSS
ncbi:MAG: hypothetical protein R2865_04945, partial [Deinococcales bacterium]